MNKLKLLQVGLGILVGYFLFRPIHTTPDRSLSSFGLTPLYSMDGSSSSSLNNYRGKTLLVSFWASWCEICQEEMPKLIELNKRIAHENFQIILVNEDEDESLAQAYAEKNKLCDSGLKCFLDKNFHLAKELSVQAVPSSFLLNQEGKLILSTQGAVDWLDTVRINEILSLVETTDSL